MRGGLVCTWDVEAQCSCDHHLPPRNSPRSKIAFSSRQWNPRRCRRLWRHSRIHAL